MYTESRVISSDHHQYGEFCTAMGDGAFNSVGTVASLWQWGVAVRGRDCGHFAIIQLGRMQLDEHRDPPPLSTRTIAIEAMERMRVVMDKRTRSRTLNFFWYAHAHDFDWWHMDHENRSLCAFRVQHSIPRLHMYPESPSSAEPILHPIGAPTERD